MHELSLCRSIVDIVNRHADGRDVRAVHLRVGQLRQIVPDTLVFCWGLMNENTPLAGSALEVESVAAEIRCRTCSTTTTISQPILVCSSCTGTDVEIVAGEEFLITTLDLAET
jgi:hydrogenase nickel incorporation protein HypA/HybF